MTRIINALETEGLVRPRDRRRRRPGPGGGDDARGPGPAHLGPGGQGGRAAPQARPSCRPRSAPARGRADGAGVNGWRGPPRTVTLDPWRSCGSDPTTPSRLTQYVDVVNAARDVRLALAAPGRRSRGPRAGSATAGTARSRLRSSALVDGRPVAVGGSPPASTTTSTWPGSASRSHPAHRRRGHGTAMLEALVEEVRAPGPDLDRHRRLGHRGRPRVRGPARARAEELRDPAASVAGRAGLGGDRAAARRGARPPRRRTRSCAARAARRTTSWRRWP